MLLKNPSFQRPLRDIVQRERNLLILRPMAIVMTENTWLFLGSDHTTHQFHSRIVLAAVTLSFCLYGHILQHPRICLHLHVQMVGRTAIYADCLCRIAYRRHLYLLPIMTSYPIVACRIRNTMDLQVLISNRGKGNRIARLRIGDISHDLCLCQQRTEAT